MRRSMLLWAVVCSAATVAGEQSDEVFDRFELYTGCSKVQLLVHAGGYEDRISTFAEARLRGARLFTEDDSPFLYIRVVSLEPETGDGRPVGVVMSWRLGLSKALLDSRYSGQTLRTETWSRYGLASASVDDAELHLLDILDEAMDHFIASYLRVNEDACNGEPG